MAGKEKTIKELKEALDSLDITNKYRLNIIRAIEYLQEEPVSEGLEEAADKALSNVISTHEIVNIGSCLEMFRFGAKWQKKQIMAKSVDGEILEMEDDDCSICSHTHLEIYIESDTLEKNNFKNNDKVKVIIVKED